MMLSDLLELPINSRSTDAKDLIRKRYLNSNITPFTAYDFPFLSVAAYAIMHVLQNDLQTKLYFLDSKMTNSSSNMIWIPFYKCRKEYEENDMSDALVPLRDAGLWYKISEGNIYDVKVNNQNKSIYFALNMKQRSEYHVLTDLIITQTIVAFYAPATSNELLQELLSIKLNKDAEEKYSQLFVKIINNLLSKKETKEFKSALANALMKRKYKDIEIRLENTRNQVKRAYDDLAAQIQVLEELQSVYDSTINDTTREKFIQELEDLDNALKTYKCIQSYEYNEGNCTITMILVQDLTVNDYQELKKQVSSNYHAILDILNPEQTTRTIRVVSAVEMDLLNYHVTRAYPIPNPERYNALGSPHVNEFGCFGNNERIICDMMIKHDYIGVLNQTLQACSVLNAYDYTVVNKFKAIAYHKHNVKYIYNKKEDKYETLEEFLSTTDHEDNQGN